MNNKYIVLVVLTAASLFSASIRLVGSKQPTAARRVQTWDPPVRARQQVRGTVAPAPAPEPEPEKISLMPNRLAVMPDRSAMKSDMARGETLAEERIRQAAAQAAQVKAAAQAAQVKAAAQAAVARTEQISEGKW